MKSAVLIFTAAITLVFATAGDVPAVEVLYARYPALSPDGRTVAFTYMGDIWTVPSTGGEATRLTAHEAEDKRPHYSPDGSMILFSSRRHNHYDVFTIPAEGGTATRLTHASSTDIGAGWFPNSDSVLFASHRSLRRDLYKMSINGGVPVKLTGYAFESEYDGRLSPDGRYMLFTIGSGFDFWYRRDIRTGRNSDLFVQDRRADEFSSVRLTDFANHDVWPVLNQETETVYFVSCRGDWAQVWKVPMAGGPAVQVTNFAGDGVQWLNSNPQGTMLTFEQGFKIWIMDAADEQPREVPIQIRTDERDNLVERREFTGSVESYTVSPDEKKIAVIIHGEIFVLPAEDPEKGKRITHTAQREKAVVWGEDSRTVFYSSDRHGNYDIFKADVTTGEETRLTDSDENDAKPVVSPDGKYLVFYRGLDRIMRLDIESGDVDEWVNGSFLDMAIGSTREYDWSPDSKWLAFTMADSGHQMDIYVADLEGEVHNLSQFINWNYRPRFSSDGKKLYFSSASRDGEDTYEIDLVHEPVEFFESAFDSLFVVKDDKDEDEDKDKDKKDKKKDEDKDVPEVVINFDQIERRRHRPYNLDAASDYPVLTPDGEKYLFVANILGESQIWSVKTEDDPDLKQLTHSDHRKRQLTVTSDSKSAYYLENGRIKKLDIGKAKSENISFGAIMEIDLIANNRQKYEETWQMLNSYFYDSTFHGADWDAVREKYRPVIEHIRTPEEFRNVDLELMGELRASHLNVYSREPRSGDLENTGYLGMEFDDAALDREGVFRVTNVLTDSPADLKGIKTGQYIRSLDGTQLSGETNWYALLAGTVDRRVQLTVSDSPRGTEDTIFVKPINRGANIDLIYEDWVRERRRMVDSLSGGRLAYLHIRAMNMTALNRFREELVALAEPKEGMVIDVRNNGGGWTSVRILGMLVKTPYILRAFRGLPPISENKYRSKAYERPMICLINNYSYSNAEIFAEGFRKLKLGKVVGEPTAGYVIGTSSYRLIDGTRIRRPSSASYTTEMEDTDLEPRHPDILVENLPDDLLNGRDPQLVRAVEELLSELE